MFRAIDRLYEFVEARWWAQVLLWIVLILGLGVVMALDNPREYI